MATKRDTQPLRLRNGVRLEPGHFSWCFRPELCYLVSMAVGFPVSLFHCSGAVVGYPPPGHSWQFMPEDESGEVGDFWTWYLDRQQFFPTPEAAALKFVAGYHEWRRGRELATTGDE